MERPAIAPPSTPASAAQDFFGRQTPTDQTRFAACLRMSGHEWQKVLNGVQSGLEPTNGNDVTCMLSLNPGRLCEPSEVQSLVTFLTLYMQQRIAKEAANAPSPQPAKSAANLPELRRNTIGTSLDKTFINDLRDLIFQGYLKVFDLGSALPVEAQASLAGIKIQRAACR